MGSLHEGRGYLFYTNRRYPLSFPFWQPFCSFLLRCVSGEEAYSHRDVPLSNYFFSKFIRFASDFFLKIATTTTFDPSDIRVSYPRFTPEARQANQALVDLLASIAEQKQATTAQIALAWLLAQKPWIVPIPGTRKLERLDENMGDADVELTSDDLREIERAASNITVQGSRLPENILKMTGR
jgi:hypothetical protein